MDGFERPYWSALQALAWVYLGDRSLVAMFDPDVNDHGTFWQEVFTPDGKPQVIKTRSDPPSLLTLRAYAVHNHGCSFPSPDEKKKEILDHLASGTLSATGLENGEGPRKPIPVPDWNDLFIDWDHSRTSSRRTERKVSQWDDLRFERKNILAIWADPFESSAAESSSTIDAEGPSQARPSRKATRDFSNNYVQECNRNGSTPTQVGLVTAARDANFNATREQLHNALKEIGPPIRGRPKIA